MRDRLYFAAMFLLLPAWLIVIALAALKGERVGKAGALIVFAPFWALGALLVWAAWTDPAIRVPLLGWAAWAALVIGALGYALPWIVGKLSRRRR